MDSAEARKLANAFRSAASTPPPMSPSQANWREGFCDGLRFAAATLDLAADGKLVAEAEGELLAALMKPLQQGGG